MASQKKCYRSNAKNENNAYILHTKKGDIGTHQSRGGVPGKTVDTSFGAPGNKNKSKKNYPKIPLGGNQN